MPGRGAGRREETGFRGSSLLRICARGGFPWVCTKGRSALASRGEESQGLPSTRFQNWALWIFTVLKGAAMMGKVNVYVTKYG